MTTPPVAAPETGRVLGGRYRLVAPVGVGTSSRVYLAVDTQLRRRVAVKLLHEALAADDAFLRRFRAEARAAGALSHPNIVAVYDWGEDRAPDGGVVPYLVTEYLAGGSVRSLLDAGHRLTPSQALAVGLDAARALEHAHLRGLVHRDVKPGNLLFDADGRLRLADFGLARALAEASWTEPAGTDGMTARYASPEQARGRRLDGRSDVYSLALVLAECVTGQVPLTGETTASTLALRTRSDLVLGRELGALRGPLERAGRLEPEDRPDAGGLVVSLMAAAGELPRPDALPLVPHHTELEVTSELRLAGDLGTVTPITAPRRRSDAGEELRGADTGPGDPTPAGGVGGDEPTGPLVRDPIVVAQEHEMLARSRPANLGPVDASGPVGVAGAAPAWGSAPDTPGPGPIAAPALPTSPAPLAAVPMPADGTPADGTRRHRRWPAVVALAVVAAGAAAGWWFVLRTPVHEVPRLVGAPVQRAERLAARNDWRLDDRTRVRADGTRPGQVVAQRPAAGTGLAEGRRLRVTVSLGPTLVAVPDLARLPEAEAATALTGAGLAVGRTTTANDEQVPQGAVVSASAAGGVLPDAAGRLPKGTRLDLVVSAGPAPRRVPDGLVGVPVADARARLAAVQLEAEVSQAYDDAVPAGVVLRAGTEAGAEVPRGTAVALVVSQGPAPVPVPDVTGRSGTAAAAALEAAGFPVSGIEGPPSGPVLATDPPAGEPHQRGTAVRVFTRR